MQEHDPEFELQHALDLHWDHVTSPDRDEEELNYLVQVPAYVLQDAVERLRRYSVLVDNLTKVGNFLWEENLRKYGQRRVHKAETPWGCADDPTYKSMGAFVDKLSKDITIDDAYVELALSINRIKTGDASGLNQYLEKEEKLFEQLDGGE